MRLSIILPAVLASLSFAYSSKNYSQYEAIHQAEYKLAYNLDNKKWDLLHESMTQDVVYDNSAFGPGKGGVSTGLDEVIKNTKAAFGDSMVEHIVANALIDVDDSGKRAHVITYLIFSKWDTKALGDPDKTYRVYEKCDDTFVIDDGAWKLKYSKVTNMGPAFEMPYFNKTT